MSRTDPELWYVAVTDFPSGLGSTTRARSMCRALSMIGYDVHLLIPHAIGHGRNDAVEGSVDGIPFEYLNRSTTRPSGPLAVALAKIAGNLRLIRRVIRARRRLGCAFVYNASLFDCWGVLITGRLLGIPVILDLTDEWHDPSVSLHALGVSRYLFKRLARATENVVYGLSAQVIVVSRHLERRLARYSSKTIRCPVAFDPSNYARAEPVRLAPAGEFAVIYAGSISGIEGVDVLLEAFRLVGESARRRVRLFIVGNPAHNETVQQYEAAAADLIQAGLVSFLPGVDHARYASLLRGADLLVIPRPITVGSSAGFPYKLVECIASGTPVLVTRFGDVEEYFESGVHCLTCAPGDAGALAAGIQFAMDRTTELRALAPEGQKRVRQLFAFESVAGQLRRMLEGISARGVGGPA